MPYEEPYGVPSPTRPPLRGPGFQLALPLPLFCKGATPEWLQGGAYLMSQATPPCNCTLLRETPLFVFCCHVNFVCTVQEPVRLLSETLKETHTFFFLNLTLDSVLVFFFL